MKYLADKLATEFQIRQTVAELRNALDLPGQRHPNVWTFFSNKNGKLFVIIGDVGFIQAVLLEGDSDVAYFGAS